MAMVIHGDPYTLHRMSFPSNFFQTFSTMFESQFTDLGEFHYTNARLHPEARGYTPVVSASFAFLQEPFQIRLLPEG